MCLDHQSNYELLKVVKGELGDDRSRHWNALEYYESERSKQLLKDMKHTSYDKVRKKNDS